MVSEGAFSGKCSDNVLTFAFLPKRERFLISVVRRAELQFAGATGVRAARAPPRLRRASALFRRSPTLRIQATTNSQRRQRCTEDLRYLHVIVPLWLNAPRAIFVVLAWGGGKSGFGPERRPIALRLPQIGFPAEVSPVIIVGAKCDDLFALSSQTQVRSDDRETPFFAHH